MIELVRHSLTENEEVLRRGLRNFVEVGHALMEIRDDRQYVEAGFDTFEDYCRERWDIGHRYASNQIDGARVVDAIELTGARAPVSEFHARPLVKVLNQDGEDAVVRAWVAITQELGDEPITQRQVRRFLTFGEGANYGKPGWHELIGQVGDDLTKTQKDLAKFEAAVEGRKIKQPLAEKARAYAERAREIAARLDAVN